MALEIRYATTIHYQEEHGIPKSARTRHMVLGGTQRGSALYQEILSDPICPQPGDASPTWPNLRLVGRELDTIPERPDGAWLDLIWSAPQSGGGVSLGMPTVSGWSGSSDLTQITTQKDINGEPIYVMHAWHGDPDFGNRVDYQGADVSVLAPSGTLRVSGTLYHPNPYALCDFWRGAVNALPWGGKPAGAWLVTVADFEPVDTSSWPPLWRLTFQFSLSPEGVWDPVVWFRDPRTQAPAHGLVPGGGIKVVDWYRRIAFQYTYPYFRL